MPGSVKLEAPCQRSRVHWLGTRMPWRDYNFSERRDLAGGAGFLSFQSLLGRGVIVGLQAARCFSVVKQGLEVDRVCACFILRHTATRTFVYQLFKNISFFVCVIRNSLELVGNLPTASLGRVVAKLESAL